MKIYSEELKKIKLIDAFEIVISGEWGEENLEDNENTAYIIRTTNFLNDGTLDVENRELVKRKISREKIDEKHLKRGDIIIEKSGGSPNQPVGRVVYFDIESEKNFLCNNFTSVLRVKEGIEPKYIFYFLKDCYKKRIVLKYQNKTTGIINLKLQDYLKNTEIQLPNIEIQKKIVEILDKVFLINSLLIEKERRISELNKSIFVKMFGDPILDDSINKIELEKICKISSSKRIFEKEYVSEGIPFYRTKEIVELAKGNKISTELYISKKRYLEIKEQFEIPQENDILITAVGTIGTIWIVDNNREFYFKDGNILRISASKKFNSIYMKRLLEILIENLSKSLSTGTAYSALTINSLKKMLIKDIDLKMQNRYANKIRKIEKSKVEIGAVS